MPWQDLVFLVGGFFGAVILWPGILDPDSAWPRKSSVPTAIMLAAYTVAFYTLGLHLSAIGSVLTGGTWAVIALFKAPETEKDD
jgi:hypothetical protein